MKHTNKISKPLFLFQVYVGLSELWRRLRDAERAVACAARACDLGRGPRATDLNTRHHRTALLQMAAALRARGELGDAHDYCNVRSYFFFNFFKPVSFKRRWCYFVPY